MPCFLCTLRTQKLEKVDKKKGLLSCPRGHDEHDSLVRIHKAKPPTPTPAASHDELIHGTLLTLCSCVPVIQQKARTEAP